MSPEQHVQAYQRVLEKRSDEIEELKAERNALRNAQAKLAAQYNALSAELQRYREREPLVKELLDAIVVTQDADDAACSELLDMAAAAVSDFDLTLSVKCPSQADGSADDLTPAAPADAAESHEKSGSEPA